MKKGEVKEEDEEKLTAGSVTEAQCSSWVGQIHKQCNKQETQKKERKYSW